MRCLLLLCCAPATHNLLLLSCSPPPPSCPQPKGGAARDKWLSVSSRRPAASLTGAASCEIGPTSPPCCTQTQRKRKHTGMHVVVGRCMNRALARDETTVCAFVFYARPVIFGNCSQAMQAQRHTWRTSHQHSNALLINIRTLFSSTFEHTSERGPVLKPGLRGRQLGCAHVVNAKYHEGHEQDPKAGDVG